MGIMDVTSKMIGRTTGATNKLGDWFHKDPEKAIAYTTAGSIIIKDGIGCYRYVTQSLNNDKIPEDKRSFVAALDLTNGVLMILAQISLFFATRKFSTKLFDKIYKSSFGDEAIKNGISKIRAMERKEGLRVDKKLKLEDDYKAVKKSSLDMFKFLLELSAATILGKRVIVPLIATPLADKVKQKMENNKNGKANEAHKTHTLA